jgi:hypothetical protein
VARGPIDFPRNNGLPRQGATFPLLHATNSIASAGSNHFRLDALADVGRRNATAEKDGPWRATLNLVQCTQCEVGTPPVLVSLDLALRQNRVEPRQRRNVLLLARTINGATSQ